MKDEQVITGICDICYKKGDIIYTNIFWNGSEGLNTCQECKINITNMIRELIRDKARQRKLKFINK